MQTRKLGPFDVSTVGLGCMCLSHAYGTPPTPDAAAAVLHKTLDLGYTHLDSAALYGFGANETLLGRVLKHRWLGIETIDLYYLHRRDKVPIEDSVGALGELVK